MSADLEKAQEIFNQGLWTEQGRRNEFFAIVLKSLIKQEKKNEYIDGVIEALTFMDKLNLLAIVEIAKALGEKFPEFENLPEQIKSKLEQQYIGRLDNVNNSTIDYPPDFVKGFNVGAKHIDGYLTLIK